MVANLITLAPNIYEIPDISHLTGDWLTVARMHVAVINDPTLPPIDHAISRSGLKALLNRYDPTKPVRITPLVKAKSKRGQKAKKKAAPKLGKRSKSDKIEPSDDIPGNRPVISLLEAATRAGIGLTTAKKWIKSGKWEAYKSKEHNGMWWVYADQPGMMEQSAV